jgi:hypothetical protein
MPDALKAPSKQPPPAKKAPPKPAPERKKAPPKERGGRSIVPFAVAAAVLLAIGGYLIGGSGGSEETPAPPGAVTQESAAVAMQVPGEWSETQPPSIPGLELGDAIAASSGGKPEGPGIVAGVAPSTANNFTLLPNQFLATIGGAPEERPAVELPGSGLQAYRYADLQPEGFDGRVTVYAVQTTEGVVNAACFAPAAAAAAAASDCDAAAATLEIRQGEALPVGPSAEYAERLDGVLRKLNRARESGRNRLRSADDNRGQAAAAASIAGAYGDAARGLRGDVNPADASLNKLLTGALKKTQAAYGRMAAASRKNNRSAYVRGQRAVRTAEKDVAGAMNALRAAGYDVG